VAVADHADARYGRATVDAWVTIGAAAIGGTIGALITAFARMSHERAERIRERKLAAADDFTTGVIQAVLALRDARQAALSRGTMDETAKLKVVGSQGKRAPEFEDAIEKARSIVDEAHARQARIVLLFGWTTPAGKAARSVVLWMRRAVNALEVVPYLDLKRYNEAVANVQGEQVKFSATARGEIQRSFWRRDPGRGEAREAEEVGPSV
jgi:hypothetical protein